MAGQEPTTDANGSIEHVTIQGEVRSGSQTTEFKGKVAVQLVMLIVVVLKMFKVDVQIDEQTAIAIAVGLEALYTVSRTVVKAAGELSRRRSP